VDAVGVVTVLPPGVVVVVAVPPVIVVVLPVVVLVVAVPVVVVAAVPLGEMLAPHTGAALGFVMTTSVMTSCWPAGTVNAVTPGVPGSTVRAIATICSTAGDEAASAEGDDVVVGVLVIVGVV
jgi:hypothetical protein